MLQLFFGCCFFLGQTLLRLVQQLQLLLQLLAKVFSSIRALCSTVCHVGGEHNLRTSVTRHNPEPARHTHAPTCALYIFSRADVCCSMPCPSASSV
jgi:hypothetical protein